MLSILGNSPLSIKLIKKHSHQTSRFPNIALHNYSIVFTIRFPVSRYPQQHTMHFEIKKMIQTPNLIQVQDEATGPMATKSRGVRKPIIKSSVPTAATFATSKSIFKKAKNIVRVKNASCKSPRCRSTHSSSGQIWTKITCGGDQTKNAGKIAQSRNIRSIQPIKPEKGT